MAVPEVLQHVDNRNFRIHAVIPITVVSQPVVIRLELHDDQCDSLYSKAELSEDDCDSKHRWIDFRVVIVAVLVF